MKTYELQLTSHPDNHDLSIAQLLKLRQWPPLTHDKYGKSLRHIIQAYKTIMATNLHHHDYKIN